MRAARSLNLPPVRVMLLGGPLDRTVRELAPLMVEQARRDDALLAFTAPKVEGEHAYRLAPDSGIHLSHTTEQHDLIAFYEASPPSV